MPELIWRYLTALLYYRTSGSCVALAAAIQSASHHRLTRPLQADWSGQTLLKVPVHTLFCLGTRDLIRDDKELPKGGPCLI
jgi:hypothetical protein